MSRIQPHSPKQPQIRRCGFCQKVGHNRSRCLADPANISYSPSPKLITPTPSVKTTPKPPIPQQKKLTPPPIHFFVHHVNVPPPASPHVVNLKKESNVLWEKIQAITPEEEPISLFQNYHTSSAVSAPKNSTPSSTENLFKNSGFINFKKKSTAYSSLKKNVFKFKEAGEQLLNFFATKHSQKSALPNSSVIKTTPAKNHTRRAKKNFQLLLQNLSSAAKSHITFRRLAPVMAIFMIFLILPGPAKSYYYSIKSTKEAVALNSTEGFMALQESTAALFQADLLSAEESTEKALQNFNAALTTMKEKHRLLQKIISTIPVLNNQVAGRQNLILAGQKITLGNTYLLKGIEESKKNSQALLTEQLNNLALHLDAALPNYEQALEHLNAVSPDDLPLEFQSSFKDFKLLFSAVVGDFKKVAELNQSLEDIFGGKGFRRYLLIFQNPDELRPTGGFMGSFAELDIKDGKIEKIDIPAGGTYDVQGQLDEYIEPPAPFLIVNKRWEFQDANWFPDFPTTAQKIIWFYRHTGRGSVDGVITINSSVLKRLLTLMGPITDEKRNLTLTADNVLPTIQAVVEEGPEKKLHQPKQILGDLAPKFVEYVKNIQPHQLLPLLSNLKEALDQKEIQAFFSDQQIESQIKSFGWTGNIIDTSKNQDYLMVVNTNIRGQKSDARIKQKISHQTVIQDDGSIIDTVVISRDHSGNPTEKFYGQTNINYLRIYVPEGSEILSASGFKWPDEKSFRAPDEWTKKDSLLSQTEQEISLEPNSGTRIVKEFGKTSFGNWVITEPGETSQVQFSYRLPFKLSDLNQKNSEYLEKILPTSPELLPFQLSVQRQSGSESSFESQIIFPSNWHPVWKDNSDIDLARNGAVIPEKPLLSDSQWSLAMKKTP